MLWRSCAKQDNVVVIFRAPVAEPRSRQRDPKNLLGQHSGIIFYQRGLARAWWAHVVVDEGACMQASKEQKKYRLRTFVKVACPQEIAWVKASIINDLRSLLCDLYFHVVLPVPK